MKPWNEVAVEKYGPLLEQVSLNYYFNRYVKENGRIPSKEQFLFYIETKQLNKELASERTLPRCILTDIDKLFECYQTAFVKLLSLPSLEDLDKAIGYDSKLSTVCPRWVRNLKHIEQILLNNIGLKKEKFEDISELISSNGGEIDKLKIILDPQKGFLNKLQQGNKLVDFQKYKKEIDKNIKKIDKQIAKKANEKVDEKRIAVEEIKAIFEKEKKIYDKRDKGKGFNLADIPVELFNCLSELSCNKATRSRMDDFYHGEVKKIQENRKSLIKQPAALFGASEIHQNKKSNDETMETESLQLRNSR